MTDAAELIFVGIDVSKATLEVALDDKSKTQTLGNDSAGIDGLLARLKPLGSGGAVRSGLFGDGGQPAASSRLCQGAWLPG